MLISMLIKMISLWIMGTMRRYLREVLSIWFMMMPMTVSRTILEFNLVLNILIVFSELILSYTLGTPQTQHIALNSNVNIRYFNIFSQSAWSDFKFFKSVERDKVWVPVSNKHQWFEYWFCSFTNEYRYLTNKHRYEFSFTCHPLRFNRLQPSWFNCKSCWLVEWLI